MEDIINDLMLKLQLQREQDIVDDIIDIYKGVYKNYDEYVHEKKRLNDELSKRDKFIMPDYFTILSEDIFEYIRGKNNGNN